MEMAKLFKRYNILCPRGSRKEFRAGRSVVHSVVEGDVEV